MAEAYEAAIARRGRHRLPAARHRQDRPHRLQRARLRRARAARGWCTLDAITRRDAAADFFGEENVPREAVTMGVATILEAREIAILATGEHKAGIVRRAVEGEIDLEVAATFLQRHPNTTFYLDARRRRRADARSRRRGWSTRSSGRRSSRVRAVVWLSQRDRQGDPQARRSATTPSTSCRRWSRGTARPARSTAWSSTRWAPRSAAAPSCPQGRRVVCLLAAPRRRRDLDGRHPPQAGRRTGTRSPSPT